MSCVTRIYSNSLTEVATPLLERTYHGITRCYLPSGRGDIPAFTPSRSWYSIYRPRRDAGLSWPISCTGM